MITHRLIKYVADLWAVFFRVFVHSCFACPVCVGVFLPSVLVYLCVRGPCSFTINVVMDCIRELERCESLPDFRLQNQACS